MEHKYTQSFVIKDNRLLIGFIISCLAHILLLTGISNEKSKLLGEKYIPVQIIDLSSESTKGDSITKSQNNQNNLKSNFKDQKVKNDNKEQTLKKDDLKENLINKSNIESVNKESSPNNIIKEKSVESEQKVFGTKKGLKKENIESGSIKGRGIKKITCLKCLEPKYPKLAQKKGYEGILKLRITILKNGSVKEVSIIESTGYSILDKAGIYAAKNSKFYPISKETKLKIEYTLNLN